MFEAGVAARVGDLVGFLALLTQEARVKRDLSDALVAPLTVATSLREDLHAAVKVLLTRAQQAGAVRPELRIEDLFTLLKGLMAALVDATPDARERVAAVVVDGLRASR